MDKDEYTIKEVAQALDISERTVRRRIKSGEIRAEKKPGPFGEQWMIPIEELEASYSVEDVVQLQRPLTPAKLQQVLMQALEERDQRLQEQLSDLQKAVDELVLVLERQEKARREWVEKRDRELMELVRQLQEERQDRRPWWRRWFGK